MSGIGGLFLCLFLVASELLHPSRLGEEPCLGVQTSGATKRIRALPSPMSVQGEMERGLEKEVVKQPHEENMRRIPASTTKASQRRGKSLCKATWVHTGSNLPRVTCVEVGGPTEQCGGTDGNLRP